MDFDEIYVDNVRVIGGAIAGAITIEEDIIKLVHMLMQ